MIDTLLTATLLSFASLASAAPAPDAVVRSPSVPSAELVAFCARDASGVDKALSDPKMSRDFSAVGGEEGGHAILRYGICRSLQGAPDGCTALGGLGALGGNPTERCVNDVVRYRFVHQMLRSGDAVGVCRKLGESMGKRGPAVDRACAALAAGVKAGDAAPACSAIMQAGMLDGNTCEEFLLLWKGNPAACASLKDTEDRNECRGDAALVAGLRDPALCSASAACLALEPKKAATCDKHREEFFRVTCARVSEATAFEQKRVSRLAEAALRQTELNKKLEAEAVYATKLRAEALARMKAEAPGAGKRQFKKNAPMTGTNELLLENMDRTTKGLPHLSESEFKRLKRKSQSKTPTPTKP